MLRTEVVAFDNTTATVYRTLPLGTRILTATGLAAVPLGLVIALIKFGPGDSVVGVLAAGLIGLTCGCYAVLTALSPAEERIVIDATTREIRVFRRYPWSAEAKARTVPFSTVRSIGMSKESDDAGIHYFAIMRLDGKPSNLTLWTTYPRDRTDINLNLLAELTGFPRKDEL